jgi:hypothetical protein
MFLPARRLFGKQTWNPRNAILDKLPNALAALQNVSFGGAPQISAAFR